jgi:alpha-methylacyl-CoA racemase
MRRGPLAGVRVVEFEGVGPVPYAGMLLADMGAEVLLVRPPHPREARMPLHGRRDPLFRGRVEVVIDLKSEAGRAQLLELLPRVDILLEGYRPGVMERLGLGPEACHAQAPCLVYGRLLRPHPKAVWPGAPFPAMGLPPPNNPTHAGSTSARGL